MSAHGWNWKSGYKLSSGMTWSESSSNNFTASPDSRGGGRPQLLKNQWWEVAVGMGEEEEEVNVDFGLSKPRIILFPVLSLFRVQHALYSIDIGFEE